MYRQKDGTGATSYASLAARTSVESACPKTTPSATSRSVWAGCPVHLANRFAVLSNDSVESSLRNDENNTDLTKVTHVVDVYLPPVSPKPLKGLTKRHRGSAESIDLAQPKQSKVSPGTRDCESSRNRSAMVAPVVSAQPPVTPSVSDRAYSDDGSHHSPAGRKAARSNDPAHHNSRCLLVVSLFLLSVPFLGGTQHALKLCKKNGRLSLVSGDIVGTRSVWKLFGAAKLGPAAF
ncbi:hypothetical protein E2C01_068553 [Portunus trituberculatus]|uniref:Uncharacterized protein n=1 Tax=Portunus trituberculatus TaxID=210409 RepID=A0A5B7HMQ4_PORTR|nr:hypothetical protein [Portunus trituberculatus]